MQSVKKPGVIRSKPDINRKIPPLISSVGIMPWDIFLCALNNRLIPCLRIKKIPTRAVIKMMAIVFKIPIAEPIEIKIAISIRGIIIKTKKIITR